MPPRNSTTKAFKKYLSVSTKENRYHVPLEKIYDIILKPEDCLDCQISKDFTAYKERMKNSGIDIQTKIQKVFKDDKDGDPRYVNSEWYRNKLEGDYE